MNNKSSVVMCYNDKHMKNIPRSRDVIYKTPDNVSPHIDRCNVNVNKNKSLSVFGLTQQQIEIICKDEIHGRNTGWIRVTHPHVLRIPVVMKPRFYLIMKEWNVTTFEAN